MNKLTDKDFTNGIPICPYCKKPTIRQQGLVSTTLAYYPPIYDEDGKYVGG